MLCMTTYDEPKSTADIVKGSFYKPGPFLMGGLLSMALGSKISKANAAGPAYLEDPTEDFKLEEKRTKALQLQELKVRQEWDKVVEKMEKSESTSEKQTCIKEFIAILKPLDGVPPGVKKIPLVKLCRSKKFIGTSRKVQPTWTKEVEISYQELIQLFNRKVAPDNRSPDNSL